MKSYALIIFSCLCLFCSPIYTQHAESWQLSMGYTHAWIKNNPGMFIHLSRTHPNWLNERFQLGVRASLMIARDPFKNGFSNGDLGVQSRSLESNIWITLGYRFALNQAQSVYLVPAIYLGYSAYLTRGKISNSELGIDRNYTSQNHFFNRGILFPLRWKVNKQLALETGLYLSLKEATDFDQVGIWSITEPESRVNGFLGIQFF